MGLAELETWQTFVHHSLALVVDYTFTAEGGAHTEVNAMHPST